MPDRSPLRAGDPRQLGGYRLVGRLGEGGQGTVYLGRDAAGTPVAVKVLRAGLADDPQARRRLAREARIAGRVGGFCTARVLDAGTTDGQPFIVSEYVDGVSLHRHVADDGPLDPDDLHRFAVGSAAALAAIHRAGVVHRDFKPSNVLLSGQGPRVIDFGIARALDASGTLTSAVVGTPAYMSPEQVAGAEVTPASDVFSWGATMVYAATGRPAFGGDGIPAVLHRVLHQRPDLSAVPGSLRPLVARCLAKQPEQRPDAVTVLLTLLGYTDRPAPTGHLPPVERLLTEGVATAAGSTTRTRTGPTWTAPTVVRPPSGRPAAHREATGERRPGPAGTRSQRLAGVVAAGLVIAAGIAGGGYLLGLIPDGSASDPDRFGAQIGRTMSGHDHVVTLAVGELDGRPIAVSGGSFGDETLRLWDLTGRRQVGDTVDLDRGFLEDRGSFSVATATVSGRSVAVSGNTADTELWVWDLAAGDRMFRMDGHERAVSAVATASLAGRPVAVSGSLGGTLRIWDLTSGTQIGEPLTGHTAKVEEITIGELDGRTVAVSAADDSTVRVWDLAAGEPAGGPIAAEVGESLTGYTSWISALAVTEVDGRPVAVTAGGNPHLGSEALLWIWDLATGERVREIVTDHTSWIGSVAISRQGARTLAVTASQDTTLRVWDLATGDPVGEPFTGPEEGVRAVVTGTVDGRTVAVSGDSGGTVRLWNITLPDPSAAPPGGTTAG